MEFMNEIISESALNAFEFTVEEVVFYLSAAFLAFEFIRLAMKKMLSWNVIGDTVANGITFVASITINFIGLGIFLGAFYYAYDNLSITHLPTNGWTVLACLILADLAYYWEHRFSHRFALGWATHAVHHSSPHYNISVAYRFGPLDGFVPVLFYVPLVMLGFHPLLVLFAEIMVLQYQTFLHTEAIGKLPRSIEAIMNTPSHHRVHHGSNPQYLDKNYAGMFIIWDKMFGTFEEEDEKVVYGLTEPVKSVNPVTIFFCGFRWYLKRIWQSPGLLNKLKASVMPPEWEPKWHAGSQM